jgi:hypothetical protein
LAFTSAFSLLHFCFKCFFLASSYFQAEEKKHKEKKKCRKGGNLPSSSHFSLSLLAPTSALPLLHIRFKCFLLTSSSQVEAKKTNTKKKNHREKIYM